MRLRSEPQAQANCSNLPPISCRTVATARPPPTLTSAAWLCGTSVAPRAATATAADIASRIVIPLRILPDRDLGPAQPLELRPRHARSRQERRRMHRPREDHVAGLEMLAVGVEAVGEPGERDQGAAHDGA